MQNREAFKWFGQLRQVNGVVPHLNIPRIAHTALIEAADAQAEPDQRVGRVPVFRMEEVGAAAKDAVAAFGFNAQAHTGMDPSKALFELFYNVFMCH